MSNKRVVVTGYGIVSCIGDNKKEVLQSLRDVKSGISHCKEYEELGMRSHVHGKPKINIEENVDRKILRFMGEGAAYNYIAMKEAIEHSGLDEGLISNVNTGLVMGSGGPSTYQLQQAFDIAREKGVKKIGPYMVTRTMASGNSATLATPFKIKGVNYSISSACSTSLHCIGNAYDLIRHGQQEIVFAGGGEETHWTMSILFDAMGALSSKYNETPEVASRAYDSSRDGFVIGGGAGVLVVESLDSAKARGANIVAEIQGFGQTSDGYDMVQPSGEGAVRCMQMATQGRPVDYINAHGTSTPVGDMIELQGIKEVFGDNIPPTSSTKSLTGHSLGATGVQEAVYSLLMMENDFMVESANITNLDEKAEGMNILLENKNDIKINSILSNSFGFGGTNASIYLTSFNE
ncbi:MAG: beta-ketoacyl-[acyl-carrier-protein] synthase I [Pelagibacteraceae bacterium]|nr:MAG: beta-ketoacyl-[acyl-carrier-protein] synthase I [Pelagibacteraceae bacterium]